MVARAGTAGPALHPCQVLGERRGDAALGAMQLVQHLLGLTGDQALIGDGKQLVQLLMGEVPVGQKRSMLSAAALLIMMKLPRGHLPWRATIAQCTDLSSQHNRRHGQLLT